MIPWLKRFFNDEETFLVWQHRAATALCAAMASLSLGLINGTIPWPAWLPPWAITVIGGAGAALGVGQMNRSVTQTKQIAREAVREAPSLSTPKDV